MKKSGFVALVGAGPGDGGLLTRKGAALLQMADVVVYDRLVSREILDEIPAGVKCIDVGKNAGNHPVPQEEINEILLREALDGNFVVRLKGGDPFVFGRGGEELELLSEHDIPFTVVPGITSAIAAACYAGIPVTHRDACSSIHIITGHARKGKALSINYKALVGLNGTLIFLMGVSSLPELMAGLLEAGMDGETPAAVVENGTRPEQRKIVATVDTLAKEAREAKIHSPAIIVVGEVCSYGERFDWFERLPLKGRTLVATRPKASAGTLTKRLRELGAEVISYPCIETERLLITNETFENLSVYRWLLFTSKNGVEAFFEGLFSSGRDVRALSGAKIGAVGKQTAEALKAYGIFADCVPQIYDGEHLAELVKAELLPEDRVLVLGPEKSSGGIEKVFGEAVCYDYWPLYRTVLRVEPPENAGEILTSDGVIFTSASTVEGFVRSLPGKDLSAVTAFCIGRQTAKAASEYGMKAVVSDVSSVESLVETVLAHLK